MHAVDQRGRDRHPAAEAVAVGIDQRRGAADLDRDPGRGGAAPAVVDGVGEPVRAGEAGFRRVGEGPVEVEGQRALLRQAQAHELQRVAVRIVVVGQHGDGGRGVHGRDQRVVREHRCLVRPLDADGHPAFGRAPLAVADHVAELVGTDEARIRGVGHGLVGVDLERAMLRQAKADQRQRVVVGVVVVGQHGHGGRGADRGGDRIVLRHRRAPGSGDGYADAGLGGGTGEVAHRVGEAVAAGEALLRRVAEPVVGLHADTAVGGRIQRHDQQRAAVGIVVVGQHGNRNGRVDAGRRRVVADHRPAVGPGYRDHDPTFVDRVDRVAQAVGELVDAGEPGRRRVGDGRVRVDHEAARAWLAVADERPAAVERRQGNEHGRRGRSRDEQIGQRAGQGGSPKEQEGACDVSSILP